VQENNISINYSELNKVTKRYKKIKKYMKSPIYELLKMSGKEKIVKNLLTDDPSGEN
jgi:hypothetical protein